jgi:hypothetical protein
MIDPSDLVRDSANVRGADPRMQHQSLDDRLCYIAQFKLFVNVPEDVQIHFETGKNLFVYAWYVYRFHMVAEQHILATLEMAIRARLAASAVGRMPRGLARLLRAARADQLIANERLSTRDQWALERARWRHDCAEMQRMDKEGLSECTIDYSNVLPEDEDLQYDWLEDFIRTLPDLRNMHAHGSEALYPAVGRTFEIVQELINQMFAAGEGESP